MITISTYLKNPGSCLTDLLWPYSNESENKNNVASCLWSISDRTNVSTEKIYTSYESLNTQLLWARETRAWHTHGGPTPTSLQKIYIFSFWGHGGHVRLKKWKNKVLYQISLSQDPKNHWVWITLSLDHEKMFVWNVSIWVGGPCTLLMNFSTFSFSSIPPWHTGRFDSKFSHIFKTNTKFGLPY